MNIREFSDSLRRTLDSLAVLEFTLRDGSKTQVYLKSQIDRYLRIEIECESIQSRGGNARWKGKTKKQKRDHAMMMVAKRKGDNAS